MRTGVSMIALGIALAATCGSPASVHAEEGSAAGVLGGRVVALEALADQRGGADTHLSDIHAAGAVREVQVQDAMTGFNNVSDGALAGSSGMPMLIQNTGNGVLIQNAVILNVEVK